MVDVDLSNWRDSKPIDASEFHFPDARWVPGQGPGAFGADFAPATIIAAYNAGYFPWPQPEAEMLWFSPDPRAILPVGELHVSRRMARTLRSGRFRLTADIAFERVITACADRPEGTWITERLLEAYLELHELGWAHSFEAWLADGKLAGGLYGLQVGQMFGAESMFHHVSDASKAAMAGMMSWAEASGVGLIDVQVLTEHTARMGAVEVRRDTYLRLLDSPQSRTSSA